MAEWRTVRGHIATVLKDLSITDPNAQGIEKVHETPPGTLQDLPCVVMYPPSLAVERGVSSKRQKLHTVRCLFVVSDQDYDVALDIVDMFREAAIDAFDSATVFESEWVLIGQSCEEPRGVRYGERDYVGFDMNLQLIVNQARAFSVYTP